ncbi:MAG: hypothetical protein HKN05_14270 [Rhizobiales bacterium]|nr:hypothetical protein [Hyphomicrobiales bacterium]
MKRNFLTLALTAGALAGLAGITAVQAQSDAEKMSFFITSVGMGKGADLGGLAGADAHCGNLAKAAGSTRTDWKAYLSTSMVVDRSGGRPYKITSGINARDRIGQGPWHNAKGVLIANDLEELHGDGNKINLETGLDEKGNQVNGRGQKPNRHDILTGSDPQGQFSTAGGDTTCGNWTKSGEGSAIVGHHDRAGLNKDRNMISWNSAHGSRGCGEADLPKSGGAGLFYCFAAK